MNIRLLRLLLITFSFIPLFVNATHLIGGEVVYTCLGGNQYEIKVIIYRDCGPTNTNGTGFDVDGVITIYNMNDNFVDQPSHDSVVQEFVVDEFTDECLSLPPELCVEKGTYTIVTTLPNNGQGYQIVYQRCCRNEQVINIVDPEDLGSTLVAYIPPISGDACNSSPSFDSFPPLALCLGSNVEVSQSATDVDGDVLSYSLVAPFHGSSDMDPTGTYPPPYAQVAWETGYSDAYPMDSNPVLAIDPVTGLITGTPTQEGFYVIGIKVEEYRNGVYLGEILRDFRFLVVDCEIATAAVPIADVYCDGLDVVFENQSLNAFDYYWDFGDLTTETDNSTENSPIYVYSDSGNYTVTLIANPGTFCTDTSLVSFSLYPNVFPYFSLPPTDCEENAVYDFEGSGIIPEDGLFSWDFGANAANQFSNELSPENVSFTTDGPQQISFTVSYLDCEETFEQTLQTSGNDLTSISSTAYQLCEPQLVTFSANNSVTANLIYDWDLGNGESSEIANPVVTYEPGAYDVSVTVLNTETGCESFLSEDAWITVYPQPTAFFEPSIIFGCEPLEVSFESFSENVDDYEWTVNGAVVSSSESFNYTFDEGNYEVILEVSNDYFCSQDNSTSVQISALAVVDADFELNYECNEDLEITINDNSNSFTDLLWDFGDGVELTGSQSAYQFDEEGEYTVTLTASNQNSCNATSTFTSSISVPQPPVAEFSILPIADCEAGVVQFQNLSLVSTIDEVLNWDWDFGDGDGSQNFAPDHVFITEGQFYVSLNLETELGCSESYGSNIAVGFLQKPLPSFTYTIDSCTLEAKFLNQSELSDTYVWDLNGEESIEENPVMYVEVGEEYTISLIASNEFCSEETVQVIDYSAEVFYQNVYIPNVITPNGDFANDEMLISGLNECEPASLKVFNRWGDEVYYTLNPKKEPWTGLNYSNEVVEGVYFYILELKYLSLSGNLSIFR
mgnify:CR=1 FL=1